MHKYVATHKHKSFNFSFNASAVFGLSDGNRTLRSCFVSRLFAF